MLYTTGEPPLEIRHLPGLTGSDDVGYVTFVLFPRHFNRPDVASSTISHIQLFRDYLHYHIKCSKAYMHSRMRFRVNEFQKVLNRAKTEVATTDKKTIRYLVSFGYLCEVCLNMCPPTAVGQCGRYCLKDPHNPFLYHQSYPPFLPPFSHRLIGVLPWVIVPPCELPQLSKLITPRTELTIHTHISVTPENTKPT